MTKEALEVFLEKTKEGISFSETILKNSGEITSREKWQKLYFLYKREYLLLKNIEVEKEKSETMDILKEIIKTYLSAMKLEEEKGDGFSANYWAERLFFLLENLSEKKGKDEQNFIFHAETSNEYKFNVQAMRNKARSFL